MKMKRRWRWKPRVWPYLCFPSWSSVLCPEAHLLLSIFTWLIIVTITLIIIITSISICIVTYILNINGFNERGFRRSSGSPVCPPGDQSHCFSVWGLRVPPMSPPADLRHALGDNWIVDSRFTLSQFQLRGTETGPPAVKYQVGSQWHKKSQWEQRGRGWPQKEEVKRSKGSSVANW